MKSEGHAELALLFAGPGILYQARDHCLLLPSDLDAEFSATSPTSCLPEC